MHERIEIGCAGHFIAADSCRYRRHTQVGNYRISTFGNYFPAGERERREVGCDRFFETEVFETSDEPAYESEGCGCMTVVSWSAIEMVGYQTAGEAHAGHEAMVDKYAMWSEPKEAA
jgi:hypothetical protein